MSAISSMDITFLGTASAQPSSTRNHSSLALRMRGDVWLFDCGEATQHQLQKSNLKQGKINKIFITHTHGDHIFGLVPLLSTLSNGAGGTTEGVEDPRISQPNNNKPPVEIYGPLGTRAYVRSCLKYTHTILGGPYVVHELRFPQDPEGDGCELGPLPYEQAGRNIPQENGVWADFYRDKDLTISAGPTQHSVPCIGFVINEEERLGKMDPKQYIPHLKRTNTPMSTLSRIQLGEVVTLSDGTVLQPPARRRGRKVVVLGDTYDPSAIESIAANPSLLIHEATNAHLPGIDTNTKSTDTDESVQERSKSRGHSTPQMAGDFATRIGAQMLALNHFSSRYAGNDDVDERAKQVMEAIRDLARQRFSGDVVCARDLMTIDVPVPPE